MGHQSLIVEFNSYKEEYVPFLKEVVDKGAKENEGVLNILRDYYLFVNYLVREKRVFDGTPDGFKNLLSKGALDLLAIRSTLSTGCINQSLSLLRSLFETNVYMGYINTDFEKLMSYFEDYAHYKPYIRWKNDKESTNLSPSKIKEITEAYNGVKDKYPSPNSSWYAKPLKEEMEHHSAFEDWSKKTPSFFALCKLLDKKEFYNHLYTSGSESVHGSSLSAALFKNEKGILSVAPKFDSKQIEAIARNAVIFLTDIVKIGLERKMNQGHEEYAGYLEINNLFANEVA